MTPVTTFSGKTVALFGLGGSGLVTALALKEGGAHVIACDDNPAKMTEAEAKGIETGDLRSLDWSKVSALVLSPGVPLTHPEPHWSAKLAKEAGVEIIGDIELFCRERAKIAPNAPFVAITGTNGKSTTTALIAHILREAGRDVQMGGNIGTAILSLEPPADNRIHVIECSSFQIDLAPSLAPTIGVHLNLSPDHIDRHGTMENYAAIKERLVAKADLAVIGVDDPVSRMIADACEVRGVNVARVSVEPVAPKGVYADGEALMGVTEAGAAPVANLSGIGSLRGAHNAQNAAAAIAIALALNVSPEKIRSGLSTFPGLPHRMEEVGTIGSALFINDSKATNADSTEKALKSFNEILWILGGKAKEGGIEPLREYFPKIRKAYLIGAAADDFAKTLGNDVPFVLSGTLDKAVEQAAADAAAMNGPSVVLLSPACASYDQFSNYEVRGNHFRDLVRALPGLEAKGA
ncbi:UDP-N-acetylmuramoyl-L-alanine--D-glutamate ligase [Microvirga guangxiensis]|uniref:UDP-N-acetylmuramoylalanine--D-glutamate ligase n=1 Tax=Microvirga guangxiensis TaxID=549386 RepID=A0A1G5HYK3_9HYPH|nr:UDP-N-acetylmuramoyl-L-alanine--D-glutamate ligase [Microvirga guangxiensis]SCY68882.1 UDP-N-acetylmuramoylalanine--D-glutamate ligase [Microvirga guangxiensis]